MLLMHFLESPCLKHMKIIYISEFLFLAIFKVEHPLQSVCLFTLHFVWILLPETFTSFYFRMLAIYHRSQQGSGGFEKNTSSLL